MANQKLWLDQKDIFRENKNRKNISEVLRY